ncbi:MAG: hypothetical protein QHH04_09430 [Methanolinea sp.]|jgi:hypothetical protein|nr:hypothetical protein [Methanolinea sp.]
MTLEVEKFYIDITDRPIYDRLEKALPLKMSKKDLFMFALVIGYKNKKKEPTIFKKSEFFWADNLKIEDEIIIKSIAISDSGDIEILQNPEILVENIQNYAHGGILILKGKFEQYGSFTKHIEKEVQELYQIFHSK